MRKFNLALFSDALFFFVCAFCIVFAAVRFFIKSVATTLIIALCAALAAGALSFAALCKRRRKKIAKYLSDSEKKSLALHLSVCGDKYLKELFIKALDGRLTDDGHVEDGQFIYFFNFKLSPVSADEITAIIRRDCEKRKALLCCTASPDALSLAEDFDISVKTVADVYALLKDGELLPEEYALGKVKKPSVFKKIKGRFNRKLCAPLFFSGFTLTFFSFFTFYPVYYIAAGGLLMAASAVAMFIGERG